MLRWYRRHRRDLPWRRTSDPYAIWVSEVMLQQTRVEAVLPYYHRFLERFPTVSDLASSRAEEVLAVWSGLGYYRRARMLREGAIAVMERHGGTVPDDPAFLRALPGVGRYTAGAIASICFGRRAAVVDGNVERVLGRWLAMSSLAGSRRTSELWSIAESLVPVRTAADWNQALMELGATVCTPRAPRCADCPARTGCAAHATGRPESYPPSPPSPKVVDIPVAVAVCISGGRVLLEKRSTDSPLRGSWDLPARVVPEGTDTGPWLAAILRRGLGSRVGPPVLLAGASHAILRTRLRLQAWRFEFPPAVHDRASWRWIELRHLDEVAVSGATTKILRAAGNAPHGRSHGGSQAPPGTSSGSASGTRGRPKA